MSLIGPLEYSGFINKNPESAKVTHQNLDRIHQQQIAEIQEHNRDQKKETVIQAEQADSAEIKDNKDREGSGGSGSARHHEEELEESEGSAELEDEDLGNILDYSV
jgi:hypothetical protein